MSVCAQVVKARIVVTAKVSVSALPKQNGIVSPYGRHRRRKKMNDSRSMQARAEHERALAQKCEIGRARIVSPWKYGAEKIRTYTSATCPHACGCVRATCARSLCCKQTRRRRPTLAERATTLVSTRSCCARRHGLPMGIDVGARKDFQNSPIPGVVFTTRRSARRTFGLAAA